MMFDSWLYWLFFAVMLCGLAVLRPVGGKWWLLFGSYVFYGCWDWRFCLLLAASTLANYGFGRWLGSCPEVRRKRVLVLAISFNLGLLGVFKYFGFFSHSLALLLGVDPQHWALHIVLPVGISFFTFEGIAYASDIYRRQLEPLRSLRDFALFIAFFPHLVAGPIIRPLDFLPQLARPFALDAEDARFGLYEIFKGLIKKIALADYCAPIAAAWFDVSPGAAAAVPAWAGVLAFTLQIYFDFSGYTDIARGCARLLGFRFPPNFDRPYLSANISEFWRRWHISLSLWLRDYLYVALGGNRGGRWKTLRNLLLVMGLGGLWHGASWNFVVWGLYHGLLLVAHRVWRAQVERHGWQARVDHPSARPLWIALTFLLVALGWIPFRAQDFAATGFTLAQLFDSWPDFAVLAAHPGLWLIPLGSLAWCALDRGQRMRDKLLLSARTPTVVTAGVAALVFLTVFAQIDQPVPFVYFQF